MTKILRCPECGAGEQDLQVERDAIAIYSVVTDPSDPDGISLTDEQVDLLDDHRITCCECGEEGEGHNWLDGWLIDPNEEDEDDDTDGAEDDE